MDINLNTISIIGVGFVGGAMKKSFLEKDIKVFTYDKFQNSHDFSKCLETKLMFLCLPTQFCQKGGEYDKCAIIETLEKCRDANYRGIIVIKSTVEPGTTEYFAELFPKLKLVHNPEFLTARTAYQDFHNQKHIVLGKSQNTDEKDISLLHDFYHRNYPNAEISHCKSIESESMKSFVNCFYSVKIQFFNELYLLCQKTGCNYDVTKNLMLKNGWINPMHTDVPGPDGQLSYGGACFPKDTNALLKQMVRENSLHGVLEATVRERNKMREDLDNIILDT